MASVGKLQEEAQKRKEKLKALRSKQNAVTGDTNGPPGKKLAAESDDELPRPVFRSYKPQDANLQESQLPKPELTKVEEVVLDQLESGKPEPLVEEVELINLAPRKPDWDLKRDVAKKLEKLERRTQRAIAELIRERLESSKEDLALAVNTQVPVNTVDDEDD